MLTDEKFFIHVAQHSSLPHGPVPPIHLYPYVEGCCQVLDELAEVHSLVGDIVEDGLVAVALILHVAYLHLQSQPLGYLPALNHRVVFACLGLMIFLHVHLSSVAIDAPDVVGRFQVGLLHLQLHEPSGERDDPNVVSGVCFHGHDVALAELQVVHIVVVTFACVLELHLHEVGRLVVSRHVGKVVVGIELTVLTTTSGFA